VPQLGIESQRMTSALVLPSSTGARVSLSPYRHWKHCSHEGPSSCPSQSPHTSTFLPDLHTPSTASSSLCTALMMPNPYELSFLLFSPLSESCVLLPTEPLRIETSDFPYPQSWTPSAINQALRMSPNPLPPRTVISSLPPGPRRLRRQDPN
jgi:hypothetical protein